MSFVCRFINLFLFIQYCFACPSQKHDHHSSTNSESHLRADFDNIDLATSQKEKSKTKIPVTKCSESNMLDGNNSIKFFTNVDSTHTLNGKKS